MSDGWNMEDMARSTCEATGQEPMVLAYRAIPTFEIEFAALEMEDDLDLTAWDEAVLVIASARKAVTAHDADAYLGLEEGLAQAVVESLARERLLMPAPSSSPTPSPWGWSPILRLAQGLFGSMEISEPQGLTQRLPTSARPVKDSGAPDSHLLMLTPEGEEALRRGKRSVRFTTSARLLFWAEPLWFIGVESEQGRKYGQHRRQEALPPDKAPPVFRTIDDPLSLHPEERERRVGIGSGIPGLRGRLIAVRSETAPTLVGVRPGATWEVRSTPDPGRLVVAGFGGSAGESVTLQALVGARSKLRSEARLPITDLLDGERLGPGPLRAALRENGHPTAALDPGGFFRVRVGHEEIGRLMGSKDKPSETFIVLEEHLPTWNVAVRARALPADRRAANKAFYQFLGKKGNRLRTDLESACQETCADLSGYWGEGLVPPTMEEVLSELWSRPETRSIVCERRRVRDLITPYLSKKERDHG